MGIAASIQIKGLYRILAFQGRSHEWIRRINHLRWEAINVECSTRPNCCHQNQATCKSSLFNIILLLNGTNLLSTESKLPWNSMHWYLPFESATNTNCDWIDWPSSHHFTESLLLNLSQTLFVTNSVVVKCSSSMIKPLLKPPHWGVLHYCAPSTTCAMISSLAQGFTNTSLNCPCHATINLLFPWWSITLLMELIITT